MLFIYANRDEMKITVDVAKEFGIATDLAIQQQKYLTKIFSDKVDLIEI